MMSYKVVNLRSQKPDIRCDRQSIWGNPFPMKTEEDRKLVIAQYRSYLWNEIQNNNGVERLLLPIIRAKNFQLGVPLTLGCWCAPKACHCDVLAKACEWYETKGAC